MTVIIAGGAGWSAIPNTLFRCKLPHTVVHLAGNLMGHAEGFNASYTTIQEQTGMSRATIAKALAFLQALKVVEVRKAADDGTGQFARNVYVFHRDRLEQLTPEGVEQVRSKAAEMAGSRQPSSKDEPEPSSKNEPGPSSKNEPAPSSKNELLKDKGKYQEKSKASVRIKPARETNEASQDSSQKDSGRSLTASRLRDSRADRDACNICDEFGYRLRVRRGVPVQVVCHHGESDLAEHTDAESLMKPWPWEA